MQKFDFDAVKRDHPFIELEGLINPYQLVAEKCSEEFNKGNNSFFFMGSNYSVEELKNKLYWSEELSLSLLLKEEKVFLNSHWWFSTKKQNEYHKPIANPWPEVACDTFSINVNCNDVFAWGCADAEECFYSDLETLYAHHVVDKDNGCIVWCIKKRGLLPQKPVYDQIQAKGIWNLDSLDLEENGYDKAMRESAKKK